MRVEGQHERVHRARPRELVLGVGGVSAQPVQHAFPRLRQAVRGDGERRRLVPGGFGAGAGLSQSQLYPTDCPYSSCEGTVITSDCLRNTRYDRLTRSSFLSGQIYQASLAFETADGENRRDDISGDGDDADGPTAGDRPPRAQHPERTKDERKRQLLKGALLARAQEVWEQTSTGRVTISTLHREVSGT